ncbi:putative uncharacterized protein [Clostridium sp. CAG:411]|jgi:hypothetical protein|nr:phage tail tip lysozyme [Lachnospiraceae bacterium]CDE45271.1 putative uncharacterized protein [Clostridium sp. CAG:411]
MQNLVIKNELKYYEFHKKRNHNKHQKRNSSRGYTDNTLLVSPIPYSAKATKTQQFKNNQEIQSALAGMDFYSGPSDGYLNSDLSKKAIKNFQRVYGLDASGKMDEETKNKLSVVSRFRNKCASSENFKKLCNELNFDYKQKLAFLDTWVFLRKSMGLNTNQAAGVAGNIFAESAFSSDNAQDNKYPGIHNADYKYKTDDGIGYGLIQWTFENRKIGLKKVADKINISVSNINAQLCFFKKEMKNSYKKEWNKIKDVSTYGEASDLFLEKIEKPKSKNYAVRRKYAKSIYNNMKKY